MHRLYIWELEHAGCGSSAEVTEPLRVLAAMPTPKERTIGTVSGPQALNPKGPCHPCSVNICFAAEVSTISAHQVGLNAVLTPKCLPFLLGVV